ncbi:MAG: hypothetical protein ACYCPW_00205 [Nitrososphaerales archaeon]
MQDPWVYELQISAGREDLVLDGVDSFEKGGIIDVIRKENPQTEINQLFAERAIEYVFNTA